MKKIVFSMATFLVAFSFYAQNVEFGVKGGLNVAFFTSDAKSEESKPRYVYHFGVTAEIPIMDKFSIQPELLYSVQGLNGKVSDNFKVPPIPGVFPKGAKGSYEVKATQSLAYINIPVMMKYYVAEGLSLELGPQLGILVGAKQIGNAEVKINGKSLPEKYYDFVEKQYGIRPGENTHNNKKAFKSTDLGMNFGVGYKLDKLNFGVRYNLGLTDIVKNRKGDGYLKNAVIQLSVGYSF
ncbi:MAG: PorT family protein [Flavobacteriaceae bacterium]|nr:PorT family protein [Flavobacteriaceae bacterium]